MILLTLINFFNYLDRMILLALAPTIQKEMGFNDTSVGFLTTIFMVSYFGFSPLFGFFGDRGNRSRWMGFGVGLWSLATLCSGLARTYPQLLLARAFVGIGEAAYGTIGPAVLADLFSKDKRARVFSYFYMAIPVGSALGFLCGGLFESLAGWRNAFFIAGTPGLFLACFLFFSADPPRGQFDDPEEVGAEDKQSYLQLLLDLYKNKSYLFTVLGYCAYTFVMGGIAVWIPHFIHRYHGLAVAQGNMTFGAITVAAGFLGTVLGGIWAEDWEKRSSDGNLKVSALSLFFAVPVYLFVFFVSDYKIFCAGIFVLEFLLFLSTSPINAQIVNAVSPKIRATAVAVSIFAIHLLGDGISPTIIGFISDHSNLRLGMLFFAVVLVVSGGFWLWKIVLHWEPVPLPRAKEALPRLQAHRGLFPPHLQENTLAAFRNAAIHGFEMIELDVRLSKDHQVVVFHDRDLKRLAHRSDSLCTLTAAELKTMAHAPSLKEVFLDLECKSLKVNVEIKCETAIPTGIEQAVADCIRDCQAADRVWISSFNPLVLRRISRILPEVPRALLVSGEIDPENRFYLRKMLLAWITRAHYLNLDKNLYTAESAKNWKMRKIPVCIWTVDDYSQARHYLALGAESIISGGEYKL